MTYYGRRSIRLKGYDYTAEGAYFLTLCTHRRNCLFGDVGDGQMLMSEQGRAVREEWLHSAQVRQELELDEFVVMPNHLHGIVLITRATGRSPLQGGGPFKGSLGSFIAGFKAAATKRINVAAGRVGAQMWQRGYYEHVIRNEGELATLREYIRNNPMQWELDDENPIVRRRKGA